MAEETIDLLDLLSKPMSEFPDLPQLPGGKIFYGKLLSVEATHSRVKGTPAFHFGARLTDPGPDVTKAELDAIASAGFSLADYNVGADFYLTPNAMKMLRRFLTTLGFSPSISTKEALKLSASGEPTADTQEVIRGMDIVIRTPPQNERGQVYLNNVASDGMIAGKST